jgi:hypothetical protein
MPAMNELKLCNHRRQYRGHGPRTQAGRGMLPRPKRLMLVKCVVYSSETLGTGLQTPSRLRDDGVSQTLVYNEESSSLGASVLAQGQQTFAIFLTGT